MEDEWGLRLNRKKCEILPKRGSASDSIQVEGIRVNDKVKYLGVQLSTDPEMIKRYAKTSIHRNLQYIKGKLGDQPPEIKEQLLCSFGRSLIIYFGTPLVASGLWKQKDVDAIEKEQYKIIHLLP